MSLFGNFNPEITLEAAEGYEAESNGLGLLMESLDDDMSIIRAMHKYEMKSIQLEATGKVDPDEQDIEDADEVEDVLEAAVKDVFATMKTAVTNFFSKLKGYWNKVIEAITQNAKRYEMAAKSLRKSLSSTKCDITPEGYEVYEWSGCNASDLAKAINGKDEAMEFATKLSNTSDDAVNELMAEIEESFKNPTEATQRELMGAEYESGEAFTNAVREKVRGRKVEHITDCAEYLAYLEKGYGEFIKAFKEEQKNLDKNYKILIKAVSRGETASKVLSKVTKGEQKAAASEVAKVCHTVVAAVKASHSVKLSYNNVFKAAAQERAAVSLRICKAAAGKGKKEDK